MRLGEYYQDQGYVFTQDTGGPMHSGSVTDWLAKFSKRHGLPHINPHAFRHTMASMLYFNGVDSVSISKRLGHAQVSTTANIYAHVMEAAGQRNADILADVFLKKGSVKVYAQICLQAPADLKSAGNRGVVQSRLQVLHVHVFLVAPLGARHMAQPRADQH